MIQLNVDTNATIIFTNKLEKLHKSAFPNAVRNALNSAAFDVKKNQLQRSADALFEKRQPNFFKVNSKVEMAKGWHLDEMQATVGMVDLGGNNYAVDDLEQQEYGGVIGGKSFIPLDTARSGGVNSGKVKSENRTKNVRTGRNVISTKFVSGKNEGQKFARAVSQVGVGGRVLAKFKGKKILWRVNSIKRSANGQFKLTGLYTVKRNRKVRVGATNFMSEAAMSSGAMIDTFYIAAAEREFEKALR